MRSIPVSGTCNKPRAGRTSAVNVGAIIYDDHDVEPRVSRDRRDAERRTECIGEPIRRAINAACSPLAAGFVRVQILEIAR